MKTHKKADKPAGISEKVIRLLEIYTLIAQNKYPSLGFLMEHFHVSKRTIFRYLELINIIDPIEYDKEKDGYRFTTGDRIKKPILSNDDIQTIQAAIESISRLGPAFKENFLKLIMSTFTLRNLKSDKNPIMIKAPDPIFSANIESILKILLPSIQEK
ncbi:MAG: HTH domain-containing protein, partial [Deltaproteobacteria bacterium]|nr:HTH domain-containing protein [Deltaproteobacteria bacterium]